MERRSGHAVREFLAPQWWSPVFITRRGMLRVLRQAAAAHARGRLVDLGCGVKPYEEVFATKVSAYVGVDHPEPAAMNYGTATRADVIADISSTPFPDASFETLLCTQVLEHVPSPAPFLSECHRLLVPGGRGIFTVPFCWPLHAEPHDYRRYTRHGLARLFSDAGFVVRELREVEGTLAAVLQLGLLAVTVQLKGRGGLLAAWRRMVLFIIGPIVNALALVVDPHFSDRSLCLNYLIIVEKEHAHAD